MTHSASLPLEGVTVVDFTRHLPGPWCTQYLADLGASVIKVEHLGVGDPSRFNPPRYQRDSVYFHAVNAGKQSITLDLGRPDAVAIKKRLLERADIIVETLRPGGAQKLGIGYDDARAINPKIVYCSISGFGRTGPFANAPGHDLAIQSVTGLLGGTFEPGEDPRNPPFHAADYAGASTAVIGVLAAYTRMLRTGEGGYVDISMYESLMSMLDIKLSSAMGRMAGTPDQREIEVWGTNPRYRSYATKDGKAVTVGLLEASIWKRFCEAIGRPDLITHDESPEDRLTSHGAHTHRYREALTAFCASQTRDEIIGKMQKLGIPITPVYDQDEALVSDIAIERGVVDIINDDVEGRIVHLANPLRHSNMVKPRTAGPALGADTDRVLADLGFSDDERQAFAAKGVI